MNAEHNDSNEDMTGSQKAAHVNLTVSSDATQGYSAEAQSESSGNASEKLSRGLRWFRQSVTAHMVMIFALALFIELGIFNHWSLWHTFEGYQRVNVNIAQADGGAGGGTRGTIINSPDGQAVVLNDIRIRPRNLLIELSSDRPQLVEARVEFLDRGSRHRFVPASTHRLNTSGPYAQSLFHFQQRGDYIYGLRIIFKADHDSKVAPVYLTKLSFNVPEHVQISWLRLIFMLVVFNGLYLMTVRKAWFIRPAPDSAFRNAPLIAPVLLSWAFAIVIYALQKSGINALSDTGQQDLLGSLALLKMFLSILTAGTFTWALYSMLRFFKIESGAVLTAVSTMTVICGSQIFYHQMDLLKESLSPVLITLMLTVAAGSLYSLAQDSCPDMFRKVLLALFAAAVMLTVLSRAWAVLLLAALCTPVIIPALTPVLSAVRNGRVLAGLKALSREQLTLPVLLAVSLVTAVILKAVISENFMTLMLSAAGGKTLTDIIQINPGTPYLLSIENFVNALHYSLFETLNYSKNFPFVIPANSSAQSFGTAISVYERISVMAIPFAWLSFSPLLSAVRARAGRAVSIMMLSSLVSATLYAWGTFYLYGVGAVQNAPLSTVLMLASALTILALFSSPQSDKAEGRQELTAGTAETHLDKSESASGQGHDFTVDSGMNRVVFVLTMFLALKSIVIGLMLPFAWGSGNLAGQFLRSANLDALLYMDHLFNYISF